MRFADNIHQQRMIIGLSTMLNNEQIANFKKWGFLVLPEFATTDFCQSLLAIIAKQLKNNQFPIEYEADVGYPGAPESRDTEGGLTPRRLLWAAERDARFLSWATHPELCYILRQLFGKKVYLSQSHHNCVMTKHPRFSSHTGWHRDGRYWNFPEPNLISAWLALTHEHSDNGGLWVLPNSHQWTIEEFQLDERQFLRTDFSRNKELLSRAMSIELNPGDLLLFHSQLFHAAGRNKTGETKYSLVFTYHAEGNYPIAGTSSSKKMDIPTQN